MAGKYTIRSKEEKLANGKGGTADHAKTHSVKTKFSMETPVEETKDLVALHNLTEENLLGDLKLGGLPMPSIAVVKADGGHTEYGPISFVFSKDTIDPKLFRSNKVYGSDAWTPTAPGRPSRRDMSQKNRWELSNPDCFRRSFVLCVSPSV